ncbi:hypothetical protein DFH09DRAFT_1299502 [Mycena vulgaris]|nr:hypothetical protein DFH09DRAFT_1299502 [Mycena vulgaris]
MSSQSYHSASRGSRTSQPPTYLYRSFCRRCDICPTCGSSPSTARTASSVPATPAPAPAPATSPTPPGGPQAPVIAMHERILPQLPIQFLLTLFLIENQLSGDWRHLIIPYATCFLVFFL